MRLRTAADAEELRLRVEAFGGDWAALKRTATHWPWLIEDLWDEILMLYTLGVSLPDPLREPWRWSQHKEVIIDYEREVDA